MRTSLLLIFAGWIGILCISCDTEEQNSTSYTVFAAASTRQTTEEICDLFEQEFNCSVNRNYASSGMLARQIDNGAGADLYISANEQWVDYLTNNDMLTGSTVRSIASSNLVVIAPKNKAEIQLEFTPDFDILKMVPNRIAIGDPSHVPVGTYANEVLVDLGWLEKLNKKVLMAKDVSSILRYVELQECDWGIVYFTEAIQSKKVKIVAEIPTGLYAPVMFYIGTVHQSKAGTSLLNDFFNSETSNKVFRKNGFQVISVN
jgi:molybdate transport system substrate-binding protein